MPRVRYIGTTDKTDSIRGVGLHWRPGMERNVTPEVAERLLVHPDTWAKMEEGAQPDDSDPIGLVKDDKPVEEPIPVVDFHAMDRKAMTEYALKHWNEKLDSKLSTENMRHRMYDIQGKRNMEEG